MTASWSVQSVGALMDEHSKIENLTEVLEELERLLGPAPRVRQPGERGEEYPRYRYTYIPVEKDYERPF
jgi:hypothetical protein